MNSVLIIDDDKELCALMKKCVEQENLSAVVAHGGLEGLRLLGENKGTCCLIILDVMMPGMDGFQVLQKIREKNNVPVLMLTAKSDVGARIVTYGAPVLPGAMFLLGYYEDGTVVMGLPGCVMYAGATIFDLALPRIAAGSHGFGNQNAFNRNNGRMSLNFSQVNECGAYAFSQFKAFT